MATRWEVETALMWSNIRPMGRLLVLAIATKANAKTGVVADEHTPSLRTLSAMTGLAKSVLPGHLTYLSNLGWLKVDIAPRASRYERNRYTIMVGNADPTRPSGPVRGPLDESDLAGSGPGDGPLGAVRETDPSDAAETVSGASGQEATGEPAESQQAARQTADEQPEDLFGNASGPGDGPASTNYKNQSQNLKTSSSEADIEPVREDVEQLCRHLVDKIVANGSKRPTITKTWRVEARRLIDLDERPVDKALALIDWCQNDVFWRSVVRSMPKFRAQYDQLRLRAVAEWEATKSTRPRGQPRYTGPYADDAPDRDYEKGSL